jgi:hypothetical protein
MNVHNWSQSNPAVSLVIYRYTANVIALREVSVWTQMWPLSFNLNEVLVVSRISNVSYVHHSVYTSANQKNTFLWFAYIVDWHFCLVQLWCVLHWYLLCFGSKNRLGLWQGWKCPKLVSACNVIWNICPLLTFIGYVCIPVHFSVITILIMETASYWIPLMFEVNAGYLDVSSFLKFAVFCHVGVIMHYFVYYRWCVNVMDTYLSQTIWWLGNHWAIV